MKILDCTLRDGGYANNWTFGKNEIINIIQELEISKVDIIELGFMRDEIFNENRTIFQYMNQVDKLLENKKKKIIYSTMIEAFNPYPLDKLCLAKDTKVDLIRICIWKRLIHEHFDYIKKVIEKGYKITIQPSRVEQYNEDEWIYLLKLANKIKPYAVYVVDTWGALDREQIIKYINLADKYLNKNIKIGYHGHNNKMQAISCVQAILSLDLKHELWFDSSLYGMGRGAGNLNTEIILQYLNEMYNAKYKISNLIQIIENDILKFNKENNIWGYSLYYYLSSVYDCNPNFATYFQENKKGITLFKNFLDTLSDEEKVVCNQDFIEERLLKIKEEKKK